MLINPKEIYERLIKAGEGWAEAEAAAQILEETLPILKAKLMNECQGALGQREVYAKSHTNYRNHVEQMVHAREGANVAKVRWISAQAFADLSRTKAASERIANREAM